MEDQDFSENTYRSEETQEAETFEQDLQEQEQQEKELDNNHISITPDFAEQTRPSSENRGMKWFKFIIWIQLFFFFLTGLSQAIQCFTGVIHLSENVTIAQVRLVYALYPNFKVATIAIGVLSLIYAFYALYVRFQLSGFKQGAPAKYLSLLVINGCFPYISNILLNTAMPAEYRTSAVSPETLAPFIVSVVMILVNRTYFNNREDLFVN